MRTTSARAIIALISSVSPYNVIVGGQEIKDDIFQEEKVNWKLIEIDEFIDELLDWIGEQKRGSSNRELMKQDLFMLNEWADQYVWSSIETNEYVSPTLHLARFNEICEQVLTINK